MLVFIYALGYMTDAYDMIYVLREKGKRRRSRQSCRTWISSTRDLVRVGIGLILCSLTLLLTNTHTRRRYYIGNYFATGLNVCAAVALSAWAHTEVAALKERYLSGIIDFEVVKNWADRSARNGGVSVYTDSTFWFDVHYFIFGLLLAAALLLILNAIWKITLMKGEHSRLATGKGGV